MVAQQQQQQQADTPGVPSSSSKSPVAVDTAELATDCLRCADGLLVTSTTLKANLFGAAHSSLVPSMQLRAAALRGLRRFDEAVEELETALVIARECQIQASTSDAISAATQHSTRLLEGCLSRLAAVKGDELGQCLGAAEHLEELVVMKLQQRDGGGGGGGDEDDERALLADLHHRLGMLQKRVVDADPQVEYETRMQAARRAEACFKEAEVQYEALYGIGDSQASDAKQKSLAMSYVLLKGY